MCDSGQCRDSKEGGFELTGEEAFALLELCLLSPLEVTPANISALIKLADHYLACERQPASGIALIQTLPS